MQKIYRVKLWNDCGIPEELQKYCAEHGVSINSMVNDAIAEKLRRMDVHSMTIAEIEEVERGER